MPRENARDRRDAAIALAVAAVQAMLFVGVPAWIGYWVSGRVLGAIVLVAWVAVLMYAFMVRSLDLSVEGIYFDRVLGWPRLIAWQDIESIELASRAELIWFGWLWPPFPARESSPTATSLGHLRIRWRGRVRYFAPDDLAAFGRCVAEHRPDLGWDEAPPAAQSR